MPDLLQAIKKRLVLHNRQILSDVDIVNGIFDLLLFALADDPKPESNVVAAFEKLPGFVKSGIQDLLRQLPGQGNLWNWPTGGALADPGGVRVWQTTPAAMQDAIECLRRCIR